MTTPVVTVDPAASIAAAVELMLSKKISCLPVLGTDGTLAGIISEGDFLRRGELGIQRTRAHWLEFLVGPGRIAEEYVRANGRRVEEVMTTDVVSAPPSASLAQIVELMARHDIKNVPIVERGKLFGIITRSDLLRALVRVLPKTGATTADDELIRRSVVAELQSQCWSGGDLLGVTVDNGAVELNGAIFDERQRKAAVVAAENVAGVKAIKDSLFCAEPFSMVLVS
ncbi:CBS domain-containing protein [Mesorhizobium sp. M3A.F.Ca.ET.080.04.2.1]